MTVQGDLAASLGGKLAYLALFVAVSVGCFALRNAALDWDAMSFLIQVGRPPWSDLAHLIYVPTLRVLSGWLAPLGLDLVTTAALLSAGSAAVFVVTFASILQRRCGSLPVGILVALFVATTPAILDQFLKIEVYAPALAASVVALRCAQASVLRANSCWFVLALLMLAVATLFHLATLMLLPALFVVASPLSRSRRTVVTASALGLAAVFGLGWALEMEWVRVVEFSRNVRGFLPGDGSGRALLRSLPSHGWKLLRFATENVPVFSGVVLVSLLRVLWMRPNGTTLVLAFGGAPLLAFLVFGVPFLGLVLPAMVGFSLAVALAVPAKRWRSATLVALGALAALQFGLGIERRLELAHARDPWVSRAQDLGTAMAPDVTVFAGVEARHLETHAPDLKVVALLDELHRARGATPRQTPEQVVLELMRTHRQYGSRLRITFLGLRLLHDEGVSLAGLKLAIRNDTPIWAHSDDPEWQVFELNAL